MHLDRIVMEVEVDISRSSRIASHKVFIALRPLVLCIACEHALQTYANALHIVYRTPRLSVKQIEADDAVGVDVRVHRYGMC